MEPNNTDLLLFSSPQFERCGRRKRTENLRWNTILILGMAGWISTQRYEIALPTLIMPPCWDQPVAQLESQQRLTLAPSVAVPPFLFGALLTVPQRCSSNFNDHLKLCSCHGLFKNRFLGFSRPTESAYLCVESGLSIFDHSMIFCTLSFETHWANNLSRLPEVYLLLLMNLLLWAVGDRCDLMWVLANDLGNAFLCFRTEEEQSLFRIFKILTDF